VSAHRALEFTTTTGRHRVWLPVVLWGAAPVVGSLALARLAVPDALTLRASAALLSILLAGAMAAAARAFASAGHLVPSLSPRRLIPVAFLLIGYGSSLTGLTAASLVCLLAAALSEELVFRGTLERVLRLRLAGQRLGSLRFPRLRLPDTAVAVSVVSAASFAAAHGVVGDASGQRLLQTFGAGLVLSTVARAAGLEGAFVVHAVYNLGLNT